MKMPTYERRFFIVTLLNELNDANERAESEKSGGSVSTGKGSRTTKISGESLKSQIKSGKI